MILPPKPDDAKTPEELFAQVDSYIGAVHEIIERREFLELQGLDSFIDYLCKRVLALTPEEAKTYAPRLNALLEDMNSLQAHMEAAKKDVRDELVNLNKQAAAHKAYRPKEG